MTRILLPGTIVVVGLIVAWACAPEPMRIDKAAVNLFVRRAAAGITGVHTVIPGHGTMATWQSFVDNARTLGQRRA